MFTRRVSKFLINVNRCFHTSKNYSKDSEHPLLRTLRILKEDFYRIEGPSKNELEKQRALMGLFPRHADVLIIGGGAIGSSIAYWLKEKTSREGIRVIVIEKDMTYSKCTTVLSPGALHQHFALPENIQMSLFGAEFLRTIKKRFGNGVQVNFNPQGHLVLADEAGAQHLVDNSVIEREFGVINELLSKEQLKNKFPWMNVEDVELGCLGLEKQGWFDPWALLSVMRYGATDLGAQYVEGEVVDFLFKDKQEYIGEGMEDASYEAVQEAVIKLPDGQHKTMEFAFCIIAAGTETLELSQLARIGTGSGMLSIPLPIEKRKRFVYKFDCPESPPGINTPMTVDPSGLYFRRHGLGGSFLCGVSLPEKCDDSPEGFFNHQISPVLQNRVPKFSDIKLRNSWCGIYENNYFDDSGIIGPHPYYHNLYIATGFSAYGIQQAPAIGRAVAELILDGDFKTIDLTRFGFDRLIVDKPMYEYRQIQ
ncbi:FAD-dependent oxidoreductase domain-containing protein 1 [Tribolium castaneum]|uniref:FAD-dependent oxidoreductase domain-containing protein 1-like Protein n=1 Tax=Tribolium castaneum TaxID=7070 RepID=D6WK94_TRICA|nr:PREDICTED: FAD-dependent oxidoreductase domain-containing protein 1 [Tribolium castaneum]EFA03961.2 FAD-dependent oxidoreductase domain-containing protein 1-like Protein [Tribolium castaneum]|eukprot:XP_969906.2 PREDICTED: FAD-dependent oxidoreductase domain-containing protein 1 [Tribolium castaneum]